MRCSGPIAVVVAGLILAAGACGREKKVSAEVVAMAGQTPTVSRLRAVAAGICDAAELAERNANSARATFYGQSHDGLHLIARGLQDVDRAESAALLQAKEKVETDFLAPPPGPQLASDLRRLADVTRASLTRFKVNVDACPQSSRRQLSAGLTWPSGSRSR